MADRRGDDREEIARRVVGDDWDGRTISREAELNGIRAVGATLRDLDLSGASLRGTDLSGADLRGSNLAALDPTAVELREAIITSVHAITFAESLHLDVRPE